MLDNMPVTIGSLTFDHATYDDHGDVLYLHIGERQAAADSEETRQNPADFAAGLCKRMKGLEPSTFCMAIGVARVGYGLHPHRYWVLGQVGLGCLGLFCDKVRDNLSG